MGPNGISPQDLVTIDFSKGELTISNLSPISETEKSEKLHVVFTKVTHIRNTKSRTNWEGFVPAAQDPANILGELDFHSGNFMSFVFIHFEI